MSTTAQSNAELIAAYLDAVIRKDAAAVDRYFDPNVEYMVNGTREPDAAGVLPPISADCQAALPWLGLRSLSTGKTADISYSIFFELRDGLIQKYHFLENTFDVARAFYAGGSWLIETDGATHHIPLSGTIGEGDGK